MRRSSVASTSSIATPTRFEQYEQMIHEIGRLAFERVVVLVEARDHDLDRFLAELFRASRHTGVEQLSRVGRIAPPPFGAP